MIDGAMNPEVSEVDFVQDGDLNKSLKHYVINSKLSNIGAIIISRICLFSSV